MNLVKQEQIRILYRLAPPTFFMTYMVALLLVVGFWRVLSHEFLLVWLAFVTFVTVVRGVIAFAFNRRPSWQQNPDFWAIVSCVGTVAAGVNWSIFGAQFDAAWPSVYQIILFTTITGLVAGAIGSHSYYFPALASFYSPILITMVWVSVRQPDPDYFWLVPLIIIFWAIIYVSGRRFSRMLKENIQFQQSLAEANEKLALLAKLDAVTQLQNRGALEEYFRGVWQRCMDKRIPVSIAMIDIDKFKAYNDFYGHVEGDRCLRRVANILRHSIPEELGFVGRYGGEEFIAVLPGLENDEAKEIMIRVGASLDQEDIPHVRSDVDDHLTISVGIETVFPQEDGNWAEAIDQADAKLYIAKQRGRARIVA